MKKKSKAVDAYIDRSAEFARPILIRFRELVHQACPDIEEAIKWGVPHFEYKGMLASMAAFKQHVSFGFWKTALLDDTHGFLQGGGTTMSAAKITGLADLPADAVILDYIRQAMKLNEDGVKVPKPASKRGKTELVVPDDLRAALKKNGKSKAVFEAFTPSQQREYIEWLTEAKQEATRQKRLAQAIEWLAEGKQRNWKYMK